MSQEKYQLFWEKVKDNKKIEGEYKDAFGFGDSKELKDILIELVLEGTKKATTSLVKEMEILGESTPTVGDYNILLDGEGRPRAVMKTIDTRLMKFKDVPEEHAYAEGEDDRTLKVWKEENTKYWTRVGKKLGFEFNEDMEVILERFELIYP